MADLINPVPNKSLRNLFTKKRKSPEPEERDDDIIFVPPSPPVEDSESEEGEKECASCGKRDYDFIFCEDCLEYNCWSCHSKHKQFTICG